MKKFLIVILSVFTSLSFAKNNNLILNTKYSIDSEKELFENKLQLHTSFKSEITSNISYLYYTKKKSKNWYLKKLFDEHFFILNTKEYKLFASPIVHFSKGKELVESKNTFVNSRGYWIEGELGEKISFFTFFMENQAVFPQYLNTFINKNKVVPGQGFARNFKENGFDYSMSSGHVTYKANNMFMIQFGHGKHFIGDGHRSLLLSDNTFNYPFLKIQTNFWKFQYTNLYAEFMDINYFTNNSHPDQDQIGYPKKYFSSHFLSFNVNSKFNISFFESIIWRANHAPGTKGFDINYLNPIIMLRPIEYSLNSPDNVLIGINTKYNLESSYFYGQIVLDEFSLNDLRKKNDFWANKFGYQIGMKFFNALKIPRLTLQAEYNFVRPYTYAHHNPSQNYAHYNQPLAHPLGANFDEKLLILNYTWQRFEIDCKLMLAKYGGDFEGDTVSYGSNLYLSTGNFYEQSGLSNISSGRPSDFGIKNLQGNLSNINYQSLNVSYIINPNTNLKLNIGVTLRKFKSNEKKNNTRFINFGIKSDLFNHYYDI